MNYHLADNWRVSNLPPEHQREAQDYAIDMVAFLNEVITEEQTNSMTMNEKTIPAVADFINSYQHILSLENPDPVTLRSYRQAYHRLLNGQLFFAGEEANYLHSTQPVHRNPCFKSKYNVFNLNDDQQIRAYHDDPRPAPEGCYLTRLC